MGGLVLIGWYTIMWFDCQSWFRFDFCFSCRSRGYVMHGQLKLLLLLLLLLLWNSCFRCFGGRQGLGGGVSCEENRLLTCVVWDRIHFEPIAFFSRFVVYVINPELLC